MKIGQFSDSFLPIVDGVGRVVYNYCHTLGSMGYETSAIVPMEDMGYRGNFPFEIIDYYSQTVPSTAYNAGIPLLDNHYDKRLEMTSFDIVHVHTPFIAGIQGIKYAKAHNIPLIGSFHSKYYDDFLQITGSKHLAKFGTDIIVNFYDKCDEVWTVSENSAETLKTYGYNRPIYVIGNGMDIKDVDDNLALKAKEYFNINDDVPILLYVGQINWKKNLERILEASSLLKKDNIKFKLVLAGKGPHMDEVKKKAGELDISDEVMLTGHILDEDLLSGLYALADIFVFPSLYDTYSMVVREAAIAKTASVVVKGSAPAECIKDKENGMLCDDTSESLFSVLKECLLDKEFLKRLGENAKKTIPVSWDVIMKQAVERYKIVIEDYKEKNKL
jgi:1,2-diacylglycerol 3-alpha-glucosyltransferase